MYVVSLFWSYKPHYAVEKSIPDICYVVCVNFSRLSAKSADLIFLGMFLCICGYFQWFWVSNLEGVICFSPNIMNSLGLGEGRHWEEGGEDGSLLTFSSLRNVSLSAKRARGGSFKIIGIVRKTTVIWKEFYDLWSWFCFFSALIFGTNSSSNGWRCATHVATTQTKAEGDVLLKHHYIGSFHPLPKLVVTPMILFSKRFELHDAPPNGFDFGDKGKFSCQQSVLDKWAKTNQGSSTWPWMWPLRRRSRSGSTG